MPTLELCSTQYRDIITAAALSILVLMASTLTNPDRAKVETGAPERSRPANPMAQTNLTPLFRLPSDVFAVIWDELPPYSRVCLTLTCQAAYNHWGSTASRGATATPRTPPWFSKLERGSLQRLFLLRQLRKETSTPQYICHGCLKFHKEPYLTSKPVLDLILGDYERKYAANNYELGDDELMAWDLCGHRRARGSQWYNLDCGIIPGDELDELLKECGLLSNVCANDHVGILYELVKTNRYHGYVLREGDYIDYIHNTHNTAEIIEHILDLDIDICDHLWLGRDFMPEDGSLSAQVLDLKVNAWVRAICHLCHIKVLILTKYWGQDIWLELSVLPMQNPDKCFAQGLAECHTHCGYVDDADKTFLRKEFRWLTPSAH
ncbi:hypothetical protein M011DRAFT_221922 [Sporormia fimetaria CBS 119925]|uniref:F-box domain-containing protein n=1 Tax=Sporormia fimetaria CBS 119925 TaxID=1340428 RepID=A0A6A6V104_9PLEO|nr:hypothetical protein M011DRAFT_221922 [Sporormia fimetaria CBS 119925]